MTPGSPRTRSPSDGSASPGSSRGADGLRSDAVSDAGAWWRDGVFYEIYPRSYADSDGDGVGDLRGVIDHLDHLPGSASTASG